MDDRAPTQRKTTPRAALTPCLLLLAACSRGAGADEPRPAPPGPDLTAADPQAPPDLRPLRPGFLQPRWVWTLQGGLVLHGPYLTPLPPGGELGTADVLVTFQRGSETDDLLVGAGDPGEALVRGKYAPVLTWLDGREGRVRRVRQIAGNAPDRPGGASPSAPASVAPGGDLLVTGTFANGVVFNPGTAAAQPESTEARLYGGASLLAWDPYLARYAADGAPRWLFRGRTPGPLVKSWFNYGEGVAALPDGGAAIAGAYDDSGFVLGEGRAARTFSGGAGSYVARVGPLGDLGWAVRSSGPLHYRRGVHGAPDGALYLHGEQTGDVVFGADSFKVPLPMPAGGSADALIKLGPGGELRWVRRLVGSPGLSGALSLALAPDGDLLIAGTAYGDLTLRDERDAVLAMVPAASRGEPLVFAARLSAEGAPRFVAVLGLGLERGFAVAPAPGGDAWVLVRAASYVRTVPLDGGAVVLSEDLAPGALTLLYRLSAAGRWTAAYAIGANLDATELAALPDGAVAVAGGYSRLAQDVRIGDGAGGTRTLPPNTSPSDDRLVVMVLRP